VIGKIFPHRGRKVTVLTTHSMLFKSLARLILRSQACFF